MSTQRPIVHEDPDRTDELPALDPVACETTLMVDEGLAKTDVWLPASAAIHAARISTLEAELESRDSALKARLADSEANAASLLERLGVLEPARNELQQRVTVLSAELDDARTVQDSAEKRVAELTIGLERAQTQTQAESERAAQARSELIDAEERMRELYGKLDAQTASAKEVARLFATQYARADDITRTLDATKAKLRQAEGALQQREAELQTLVDTFDSRLADAQNRYAALTDTHVAPESFAPGLHAEPERWQEEAKTLRNQLAAANQAITARDAEAADLNAQLVARQTALDETTVAVVNSEQARAQASKNMAELNTALTAQRRELEQLRSNEHDLLAKLSAKQGELEHWRTRAAGAEESSVALQHALATSHLRLTELMQSLEKVHSHDSNVQHELKRTHEEVHALAVDLGARNSKIAALESQLAAHGDALSAIRRDIANVNGNRLADSAARTLISVEQPGRSFVLTSGTLTIGRTPENDFQIASNLVSRRHAQLLVGPSTVILEDLGSTNGCYVNARPVKKHMLIDGDVVLIGQDRYRFVADQTARSDAAAK